MAQAALGGGAVTVPEGVKNRGDVALGDMVSGHGGDGLGLNLVILEVFSKLNDAKVLSLMLVYDRFFHLCFI